jgi:hypothetical protein
MTGRKEFVPDSLPEGDGFEPSVPRGQNPLVETVLLDRSSTPPSERDRALGTGELLPRLYIARRRL